MIHFLVACGGGAFPDYFPDPAAAPIVSGVTPASVEGVAGGDEVVIAGSRLADVTTVVFGTRNATVLSATDSELHVRVPSFVASGGPVEVAVASDRGVGRLDDAFTYVRNTGDFVADEGMSAAVTVVDCPIEAWGYDPAVDDYGAVVWCGLEMGLVDAAAWEGSGGQPGYAGEMSLAGALAALPPVGQARVYGRGDALPPAPGAFPKYLPFDGSVALTTPRDFQRDLDWIAERSALRHTYYSWEADVTDVSAPYVTGYVDDEAVCVETVNVVGADGDRLLVDGDPSAWTSLDLWYSIEEDGGTYVTEGIFGGATVIATEPGAVIGDASGVTLGYDEYSGQFLPDIDRWPGGGDVPFGATYTVSTRRLESDATVRGDVTGVQQLTGLVPDLMSGAEVFDLSTDLTITWDPGAPQDDPSFLALEVHVYDTSVTDPSTGWWAEVARLVARGDDAAGRLVLTPAMTAGLPPSELTLDANYDFTGLFTEVTVARHQLRRVPVDDGQTLVVDFVHAVQGPVDLVR